MSNQITVGTYFIGFENVRVFAHSDQGAGSFTLAPSDKGSAKIEIGLDHANFEDCLAVLLHETFEMLTVRAGLRFERTQSGNTGHDGYMFAMDHDRFSEVCTKQAWILVKSHRDLFMAWKKHGPKAPKPKPVAAKKKPKTKKKS